MNIKEEKLHGNKQNYSKISPQTLRFYRAVGNEAQLFPPVSVHLKVRCAWLSWLAQHASPQETHRKQMTICSTSHASASQGCCLNVQKGYLRSYPQDICYNQVPPQWWGTQVLFLFLFLFFLNLMQGFVIVAFGFKQAPCPVWSLGARLKSRPELRSRVRRLKMGPLMQLLKFIL